MRSAGERRFESGAVLFDFPAVRDQRDTARRPAGATRDEGRGAVGQGSGDATGR